ncbi:MAG: ribosome biogenesis GTPase Der [Myxococcota bacterium]
MINPEPDEGFDPEVDLPEVGDDAKEIEVVEKPVVALIGRPNVGKSTLFNRLVGQRLAIVHDRPGVTRDRHYASADVFGRDYTLIDTGGFDPFGDDDMQKGIIQQLQVALDQADVVICLLDALAPPTSLDSEEIALLRRSEKPVIFVANKADSTRKENEGHELYRLGMERLIFISALHGRGMSDLEEALFEALPDEKTLPVAPDTEGAIRVAVIGRPNAGKSSLVNRLLGEERMLVDNRPGTTRDPIDALVERKGRKYLFVDTAGLRRKAKVAKSRDAVEAASTIQAVKSIERAEVVVLLADADSQVVEQDAKILGLALDRGRSVVVGLNKLDKLSVEEMKKSHSHARDVLSFVSWIPFTRLSAKTGRGVDRLLGLIDEVHQQFNKRVSTGELNRFFETVLERHPPPTQGGRAPRFYYITQAGTRPPTFMIVTSHPESIHFSYQRYVINAIRDAFGFEGVPIRVLYRRKGRKPKGRKRKK